VSSVLISLLIPTIRPHLELRTPERGGSPAVVAEVLRAHVPNVKEDEWRGLSPLMFIKVFIKQSQRLPC
jgi:hypothetical protein